MRGSFYSAKPVYDPFVEGFMRVGRRTTDLPRPACAARALVPERPLTPGASHPHFLLRRGGDERTSSLGPGVQPTLQTRHLRETLSLQLEHRTGARMFGGSSAVGDDQFVLGQLAGARADIGERNRDRALGVTRVVRLLGRSEEHTSELQSLRHLVCR